MAHESDDVDTSLLDVRERLRLPPPRSADPNVPEALHTLVMGDAAIEITKVRRSEGRRGPS